MKNVNLVVYIIIINVSIHFSQCKLIRRYLYSAVLFEDEDMGSRHVDFADTNKDEWKNVTAMAIKRQLRGKALFCSIGPGGWIAYPRESYEHNGLGYELIIGDICTPADAMSSVQPIGFVFARQDVSVALFAKLHFASQAKLLHKGSTSGDFKSLIFWGNSGATLEGTGKNGKVKYCLWRDNPKVCILPDITSQLGFTSSQITITLGCDFDKDKDLTPFFLPTCFNKGVERVPIAWELRSTSMMDICKDSTKQDEKNVASLEFAQVMDIWKSRILYESESFGRIHLNNLDDHPKVDAFLQFLDIFVEACPVVSPNYLSLLGQVYLKHLKEAWKQDPAVGMGSYPETFDYLSHCWATVKESVKDLAPHGTCHLNGGIPMNIFRDDKFDTVIEQIWLMLNFVASHCAHLGDYTTNQWMEFPALFKHVYLKPLEKQWITPGRWQLIYPIMFHGYDIDDQYARVLSCVHEGHVPHVYPVGRTSGFKKVFMERLNNTWPVPEILKENPRNKRGGETETMMEDVPEQILDVTEQVPEPETNVDENLDEKNKDKNGKKVTTTNKKKIKDQKKNKTGKDGKRKNLKETQDKKQTVKEDQDKKPTPKEDQDKKQVPKKNQDIKHKSKDGDSPQDKKHKDKSKPKEGSATSTGKKKKGVHPTGRSQSLKPKNTPTTPPPK